MILIKLLEPGFGVAKEDEHFSLRFQDGPSAIGVEVPGMSQDSVAAVIAQLAQHLDDAHKEELRPLFQQGIVTAPANFNPASLGMNPDGPPR